jgi:ubiquinone/menaquinone biosynthesis C-methylase UbiE
MERQPSAHEHLDGELEPEALDGTLRDLARINRRLGGIAISRRAIATLAGPTRSLHVLDVGTGAADIPLALLADGRGPVGRVTGIDSRAEIVDWGRARHPGALGLELAIADGGSLPFPDRSVDLAHASLVLHHLDPVAASQLLAVMARVARFGVVVNDLDRRAHGWVGAWLLGHLCTRNRYTRHDAPLSVRRAYRPEEVLLLAAGAGLVEIGRHWAPLRHRYALALRPTLAVDHPSAA